MPRSIQEALHKAKEETRTVVEKGRGVYDSVMALFEKPRNRDTDYIDKIGRGQRNPQEEKALTVGSNSIQSGALKESQGYSFKKGSRSENINLHGPWGTGQNTELAAIAFFRIEDDFHRFFFQGEGIGRTKSGTGATMHTFIYILAHIF